MQKKTLKNQNNITTSTANKGSSFRVMVPLLALSRARVDKQNIVEQDQDGGNGMPVEYDVSSVFF